MADGTVPARFPPGLRESVPEHAIGSPPTHAAHLRSPALRAQGMHLGRGIAEVTGKTIVSTRAKRAGMRIPSPGPGCAFPPAHRSALWVLRCVLARMVA